MRRSWIFIMMMFALLSVGCSGMHDKRGWEHTGDPETHQDDQRYMIEHRH